MATFLTGCTTGTNGTRGTDDATRTRREGTAAGAVGGAAVGAGVGALVSKDKGRGALAGAGAGALAGGLAGAAAGEARAQKKAAYIAREDFYSRRIALVRQQTTEQRSANASLRATVQRDQRRLDALRAKRADESSTEWNELRKSVATEAAAADRRVRSWQDTIEAHKAFVKKYYPDSRRAQLETDISNLEAERTEMQRQRGQLDAIAAGPRK